MPTSPVPLPTNSPTQLPEELVPPLDFGRNVGSSGPGDWMATVEKVWVAHAREHDTPDRSSIGKLA
jgi:hypothetical protein